MLQFGHDLSAVETMKTDLIELMRSVRLQFGHDLSAVETEEQFYLQNTGNDFNTATTFQPWKHVGSD